MQNSVIETIFNYDDEVESAIKGNEEYKNLCKRGVELYNKLAKILNKRQFKLFEKFADANLDIEGTACEIYFKEGFKAGLRLAVECLSE